MKLTITLFSSGQLAAVGSSLCRDSQCWKRDRRYLKSMAFENILHATGGVVYCMYRRKLVESKPYAMKKTQPKTNVGPQQDKRPTDERNVHKPREIGGPNGPEPTRYGDWERRGRCIDF